MDQGVTGALDAHTRPPAAPADPAATGHRSRAHGSRRSLGAELVLLGVAGILLIGALVAGAGILYAQFYSPSAFVERYLTMLSDGDATDALAVPGVAIDSAALEEAGLPAGAHDALLRETALAPLTDIAIVSEETDDGVVRVTASYSAGPYPGETAFEVESNGWLGVAPTWRFAQSPLAVMDLSVHGSMQFIVNGFEIDKRQVSPDGVDADPAAAVPLLVFSPGVYAVSVDTAMAKTAGVAVLSDVPATGIPVSIQAEPTEEFVTVVQDRVTEFLTECTTQQVLQPTGCPFGLTVRNRIVEPPVWSLPVTPVVTVVPDGDGWAVPPATGVAHIEVDIRSLFDGSITHVSEDVPFELTAGITVLPDGTASIRVSGPELE